MQSGLARRSLDLQRLPCQWSCSGRWAHYIGSPLNTSLKATSTLPAGSSLWLHDWQQKRSGEVVV